MPTKTLTLLAAMLLALSTGALADESGTSQGHVRGERKEQMKEYREKRKAENEAFRQTLDGMTPEQKAKAINEHRNAEFQEKLAKLAEMHQKRMAELQTKLNSNEKMTAAQKQEIISRAENEYQERVTRAKARHSENEAFFQQVENDKSLTPEQKREKIKEYMKTRKEENKEYREKEQTERKEKRQEWRQEHHKQKSTDSNT